MTTHKDSVEATDNRLDILTSLCGSGTCPTVYRTAGQSVVVQGHALTGEQAGVEVPDGEHLVEIPVEVLLAAADKIRNQA
ncbi:hypothetical protein JIG36_47970 [Actinoplanes sp. LDG1-06]|uniref:Uncharacterized protein n=1 Tax=Paractinoplanes ovalisporus TaxID=2810368 RepID=A0ABS2ATW2_9ACTN|nr:hypothetical protein [Actinoplanes ovalisporus]MBM2623261.1 hypothetical protein [Actinoplanes ovalisporus]